MALYLLVSVHNRLMGEVVFNREGREIFFFRRGPERGKRSAMMMERLLLSTTSSEEVLTAWFAETWAIDEWGLGSARLRMGRPERRTVG